MLANQGSRSSPSWRKSLHGSFCEETRGIVPAEGFGALQQSRQVQQEAMCKLFKSGVTPSV